MTNDSSFFMWGERGLVASFFADLHQMGSADAFAAFLSVVDFPPEADIRRLKPGNVEYIIEPDFGNRGFGHPDAVVVVEQGDGVKVVIIIEAKRSSYEHACVSRDQRGTLGFNSKLNGQLELDYCLALALSSFESSQAVLTEPSWILSSPYQSDRKGTSRLLKNRVVLRHVVSKLCGLPLENYYYIVLTNDLRNPLDSVEETYRPELCWQIDRHGRSTFEDGWHRMRRQFGWLNTTTLQKV